MKKTKEPQYQIVFDEKYQSSKFGLMSGCTWLDDPKRLTFLLSRYKFVSKMFRGMDRVLEVGCSDGFGARLVRREVSYLMASDFDKTFIKNANTILDPAWKIDLKVHDMTKGPISGKLFDAAYSCDVLEHIPKNLEDQFILDHDYLFREFNIDGIEPDSMIFDIDNNSHKAIWYTKPK